MFCSGRSEGLAWAQAHPADRSRRSAAPLHAPDLRPERDAYIAATALVQGLTVVTRNVADFEPTGVRLLNPWET